MKDPFKIELFLYDKQKQKKYNLLDLYISFLLYHNQKDMSSFFIKTFV